MTRIKRTFAGILAGVGWASSFGITIGTPYVQLIQQYPLVATRLVLLLGLAAAVLTMGLWVDYKMRPVEAVLQIGMLTGERVGAMKQRYQPPTPSDLSEWWNAPISQRGQQDTPPAGWHRR